MYSILTLENFSSTGPNVLGILTDLVSQLMWPFFFATCALTSGTHLSEIMSTYLNGGLDLAAMDYTQYVVFCAANP